MRGIISSIGAFISLVLITISLGTFLSNLLAPLSKVDTIMGKYAGDVAMIYELSHSVPDDISIRYLGPPECTLKENTGLSSQIRGSYHLIGDLYVISNFDIGGELASPLTFKKGSSYSIDFNDVYFKGEFLVSFFTYNPSESDKQEVWEIKVYDPSSHTYLLCSNFIHLEEENYMVVSKCNLPSYAKPQILITLSKNGNEENYIYNLRVTEPIQYLCGDRKVNVYKVSKEPFFVDTIYGKKSLKNLVSVMYSAPYSLSISGLILNYTGNLEKSSVGKSSSPSLDYNEQKLFNKFSREYDLDLSEGVVVNKKRERSLYDTSYTFINQPKFSDLLNDILSSCTSSMDVYKSIKFNFPTTYLAYFSKDKICLSSASKLYWNYKGKEKPTYVKEVLKNEDRYFVVEDADNFNDAIDYFTNSSFKIDNLNYNYKFFNISCVNIEPRDYCYNYDFDLHNLNFYFRNYNDTYYSEGVGYPIVVCKEGHTLKVGLYYLSCSYFNDLSNSCKELMGCQT